MQPLPRLDLNLLVSLDALLAERHVTRAAARLGLSQPAVSAQLKQLREAFGDPLLVPAPRGMTLTARAQALREPLRELLAGVQDGLDVEALHRIQDGIGQALEQLNVVGDEAERERSARLAIGPDTGPLLRTLLRLRHDLVMIGRAAANPLPDGVRMRLEVPLARAATAFAEYLRASAATLRAGQGPPPPAGVRAP